MNKDFVVLAISELHHASAAIMIDGEVLAAAQEERFTRLKGDCGFPLHAARFCLEHAGITPEDVDVVAMVTERFDPNGVADILFKRAALYRPEDWIREQRDYWHPKLIRKRRKGSFFQVMGGLDRVQEHHYDLSALNMKARPETIEKTFNEIRKDAVQAHLGIPKGRVLFVPHYLCHHYHAYYSGPHRGEDVAVLHLDGGGGALQERGDDPRRDGTHRGGRGRRPPAWRDSTSGSRCFWV